MLEHNDDVDIPDLFRKIAAMRLDPKQRALMNAILKVAQDLTEIKLAEVPLSAAEELDQAFTPAQARLVLEYASPGSPWMLVGQNSIGKAPASVTHLVGQDAHTP